MRLVCFSDLRRRFDLFRSAHPFDNEAFHMRDGVLFQKNIDMKNLESNITLQRGCCLFNYHSPQNIPRNECCCCEHPIKWQ